MKVPLWEFNVYFNVLYSFEVNGSIRFIWSVNDFTSPLIHRTISSNILYICPKQETFHPIQLSTRNESIPNVIPKPASPDPTPPNSTKFPVPPSTPPIAQPPPFHLSSSLGQPILPHTLQIPRIATKLPPTILHPGNHPALIRPHIIRRDQIPVIEHRAVETGAMPARKGGLVWRQFFQVEGCVVGRVEAEHGEAAGTRDVG